MTRAAREPHWLNRLVIDAVHHDQIKQHGGLPGIRDENALESALTRPQHKWQFGDERDLAVLAAAYCFALVKNHPYRDGNKRFGFMALAIFLELNGQSIYASDAGVASEIFALAAGRISERQLTNWVRARMTDSK